MNKSLKYTIPNGFYITYEEKIEYYNYNVNKLLLGNKLKCPYIFKISLTENFWLIQKSLFYNSNFDARKYIIENAEELEFNGYLVSEYQKEILNALEKIRYNIMLQDIRTFQIIRN